MTVALRAPDVLGWLRRRRDADEARAAAAEAKTQRITSELHDAIEDVTDFARDRLRQVGTQDWKRLYDDRLKDRVGP